MLYGNINFRKSILYPKWAPFSYPVTYIIGWCSITGPCRMTSGEAGRPGGCLLARISLTDTELESSWSTSWSTWSTPPLPLLASNLRLRHLSLEHQIRELPSQPFLLCVIYSRKIRQSALNCPSFSYECIKVSIFPKFQTSLKIDRILFGL